jgi:hypothetical protein
MAKIKVTKQGTYAFSIDQQDAHTFPMKDVKHLTKREKKLRKKFKEDKKDLEEEDIFLYNEVSLLIGRIEEDYIKFIGYEELNLRNVFFERNLKEGDYIVMIDILGDQNNLDMEERGFFKGKENWRDIVLSTYGPELTQIKVWDEKDTPEDMLNLIKFEK